MLRKDFCIEIWITRPMGLKGTYELSEHWDGIIFFSRKSTSNSRVASGNFCSYQYFLKVPTWEKVFFPLLNTCESCTSTA